MTTFRQALDAFERTQSKYSEFGAWDTEPSSIFAELMEKKFDQMYNRESGDITVPSTADGWQLYSVMKGVGRAATSLSSAASRALAAADSDRTGFVKWVKDQGWRTDWEIESVMEDLAKESGTPVPVTEEVVALPAKGPFPTDPSELPTMPLKNGIPGMVPPGTRVFKPYETLVKFGYKGGKPNTVQTFDWDKQEWGRSMSVRAGAGKEMLEAVTALSPHERKVPAHIAATYGHATGVCLMCGRALSDTSSLTRGYGPMCASKMR